MKKKFAIVGAACLIALSGAGYQVYADQIDSASYPTVIEPADSAIVGGPSSPAENVELPAADIETSHALSDHPIAAEPQEASTESLFFPPQLSVPFPAESSDQLLTRRSLSARSLESENSHFPTYQAVYLTSDGTEYFAAQYRLNERDVETVIRDIKDFYKEPIQDVQIGGRPAVCVDGQFRKVVHFFTADESLRVSSYYGSIEDTLAVAEQIAAQGSR